MGNEFARGDAGWNHDASLDWHLLEGAITGTTGFSVWYAISTLIRHHKALHELDFDAYGFEVAGGR